MFKRLTLAALFIAAVQPALGQGACEDPDFAAYLRENLKSMRLSGLGTLGSYMTAGAALDFTTVVHEPNRIVCRVKVKLQIRGRQENVEARVTYMETSSGGATLKWDPD